MAILLSFVLVLILTGSAGAQLIRSEMIEPEVLDGSGYSCVSAVGTDSYACTTAVPFTSYVTNGHYRFKADVANTGAATIQFNAISGPKTIKKSTGGVTTDLNDNDIRAGQVVDLVYDGTNMQIQSTLGNAASGAGLVYTGQNNTYSGGFRQDFSAGNVTLPTLDTNTRFDNTLEFDDQTPATITADQNNYNAGTKIVWRFATNATRTFTGFTGGGNYRFALLINVGSFDLVLSHQNTNSTTTNRIINQTGADLTVQPNDIVLLIYDTTDGRWRTTLPRATAVEVDTLLSVFNRGKFINGANSFANAMRITDSTGDGVAIYRDGTNGPVVTCIISTVENDCDHTVRLKTGKSFLVKNNAGTTIASVAENGTTTGFGNVSVVRTRAYHNTSQNINSATTTIPLLNSERYDTNNLHSTSTNTSRITMDAARTCMVSAHVGFSSNSTGFREIGIQLNGSTLLAVEHMPAVSTGSSTYLSVSTTYTFALNDYIEIEVYQDSGSTLTINSVSAVSPELAVLCF